VGKTDVGLSERIFPRSSVTPTRFRLPATAEKRNESKLCAPNRIQTTNPMNGRVSLKLNVKIKGKVTVTSIRHRISGRTNNQLEIDQCHTRLCSATTV
jgi:hypothetical protein